MEIRAIDQRTLPDVADGLLDVYRTVFFEPPWCEEEANAEWFLEHVEDLLQVPGTRPLVPIDGDRPVGFALGGDWDPGDHWCDAVTEAVGPDWTDHCFHLMELALLPAYRGQVSADASTTPSSQASPTARRSCPRTASAPRRRPGSTSGAAGGNC